MTRLKHAFMIAFVLIINLNYNIGVKYTTFVKLDGVPLKTDLSDYLKSLERILEYVTSNKKEIDMNLYFGLFLLNVNLKHALINKRPISKNLEVKLKKMLHTNNRLMKFIHSHPPKDTKVTNSTDKFLLLYHNVDSWVKEIGRFNTGDHEIQLKSKEELQQKYFSWEEYKKRVNSHKNTSPTPELSDICIASLAENPDRHRGMPYKCAISNKCYGPIENGTPYGYAISHRLLLLITARLSLGCYLYSPRIDEELTTTFCASMYDEAQYISYNGFTHSDLLLEQVVLCSVLGHAEFLQRSWFEEVLKRQVPEGCFDQSHPQKTSPRSSKVSKGLCDEHYTAVVAGALGAAVRYILESYF